MNRTRNKRGAFHDVASFKAEMGDDAFGISDVQILEAIAEGAKSESKNLAADKERLEREKRLAEERARRAEQNPIREVIEVYKPAPLSLNATLLPARFGYDTLYNQNITRDYERERLKREVRDDIERDKRLKPKTQIIKRIVQVSRSRSKKRAKSAKKTKKAKPRSKSKTRR